MCSSRFCSAIRIFGRDSPILRSAIDENPGPSLAEVSRRLGYSYTGIVQRHQPALCKQLMERRRAHIARRKADLEMQALAALGQSPPPSVRAVCRRLGITVQFMHEHFPTVEHSIIRQRRGFGPRSADVNWLACDVDRLGKHQNRKPSAKLGGQLPCSRRSGQSARIQLIVFALPAWLAIHSGNNGVVPRWTHIMMTHRQSAQFLLGDSFAFLEVFFQ